MKKLLLIRQDVESLLNDLFHVLSSHLTHVHVIWLKGYKSSCSELVGLLVFYLTLLISMTDHVNLVRLACLLGIEYLLKHSSHHVDLDVVLWFTEQIVIMVI